MSNINEVVKSLERLTNNKIKGIDDSIRTQIKEELNSLGQEIVDKLRTYTQEWYDTYSPIDYQRSYDVLDSISYNVSGYDLRVIFDMRKIRGATLNDKKGWQQHRGFDGVDFTWGLINFIENGGNGGIASNPRRNDGGIHMIEKTQKWIDEYLKKRTKEIIRVALRANYKK